MTSDADNGPSPVPTLSVVVTIVDGEQATTQVLEALVREASDVAMEILLPYDAGSSFAASLSTPLIRPIRVDDGIPVAPMTTHADRHAAFDRRRAVGLRAARAEFVAIIEDRGIPDPGWARQLLAGFTGDSDHAAVGGAVRFGGGGRLAEALCIIDFDRYRPPFDAHSSRWLTDVNVAYRRRALDLDAVLVDGRYHESALHWRLLSDGRSLWLVPDAVVAQHRQQTAFLDVLAERFHWGRLFAYTRARTQTRMQAWIYGVGTCVLPLLLLGRLARRRVRRGGLLRLLVLSPFLVPLVCAWCLGEAVGQFTRRP